MKTSEFYIRRGREDGKQEKMTPQEQAIELLKEFLCRFEDESIDDESFNIWVYNEFQMKSDSIVFDAKNAETK